MRLPRWREGTAHRVIGEAMRVKISEKRLEGGEVHCPRVPCKGQAVRITMWHLIRQQNYTRQSNLFGDEEHVVMFHCRYYTHFSHMPYPTKFTRCKAAGNARQQTHPEVKTAPPTVAWEAPNTAVHDGDCDRNGCSECCWCIGLRLQSTPSH